MEEIFGEWKNEDDRRALLANRWIYENFPCAFPYISQPTKILNTPVLARFTWPFFRKTDRQHSSTYTLAITSGQLAPLFQGSLISKGREHFLAGLARQGHVPIHDRIYHWAQDPSPNGPRVFLLIRLRQGQQRMTAPASGVSYSGLFTSTGRPLITYFVDSGLIHPKCSVTWQFLCISVSFFGLPTWNLVAAISRMLFIFLMIFSILCTFTLLI